MDIGVSNSCINCSNLSAEMFCNVHKVDVEIDNTCGSHAIERNLNKTSNCSNCSKFEKATCAHPSVSAKGMLCFSWEA